MAAIAPEQAPTEATGELKHLKLEERMVPGAESNPPFASGSDSIKSLVNAGTVFGDGSKYISRNAL